MCVISLVAALPSAVTGLGVGASAFTVGAGTILADVALGLGVASMFQQQQATNYQAQAAHNQVVAQNRALEYNALQQERNSEIAQIEAQDAIRRGEDEENRIRRQVSRTQGQQRAAFAAAGVVVDEGTPLDVLQETAAEGEQDALTVRHNAAMEAWGHDVTAQNYRNDATLTRFQKTDPEFARETTLIGGRSKLLDRAGGLASSTSRFFL